MDFRASLRTFPKKIGMKTLNYLGFCALQKTDVVINQTFNFPRILGQYLREKLPRSHSIDLPSSIWEIRPEARPYHRKKSCKTRRKAARKVLCIRGGALFGEFYITESHYSTNGSFLCHCSAKDVGMWYYGKYPYLSVGGLNKVLLSKTLFVH